ncbi:DUF2147 domain-containing protein [Dyadobacter sp. Leaf189]|uniref:DUF2147 domain-containing protein n=1 Tax=Dyadobacter sp. Leaf189 TaxID=1736295 RepID=UPI0006FF9365|nr:DUF2147 domain-containing protein [Dyadobacter sp. Leaf189]KQS28201.1 SIGNAL peptide protein [Dyadobacter sp. Leaf189]
MYRIIFTIFFVFVSFLSNAQVSTADKILGDWISEEKDSRIEIYKTGQVYFGKLVWSVDLFEADGTTSRKDVQNRETNLRTRELHNVNLLQDFVYSDGIWDNGKMYDPQSGKTYNCILRLKNDLLEIRSYIGFPLLGRSTYWKRALKEAL